MTKPSWYEFKDLASKAHVVRRRCEEREEERLRMPDGSERPYPPHFLALNEDTKRLAILVFELADRLGASK